VLRGRRGGFVWSQKKDTGDSIKGEAANRWEGLKEKSFQPGYENKNSSGTGGIGRLVERESPANPIAIDMGRMKVENGRKKWFWV